MGWYKDQKVEQLMASLGIKYDYRVGIPISKLEKTSARDNARFGESIDPDFVEMYTYAMKQGTRFPAPVLSPRLKVLAGNQRIAAAQKAGQEAIDAYIVTEATPEAVEEFARRDNIDHGKNLSEDQKIESCVGLHRHHGLSLKDLNNRFFGGNPKTYDKICQMAAALK